MCRRAETRPRTKAQISLEFLLVVGFAILLLVALLSVTAYELSTATTDATVAGMQDILDSVQLELLTAKSVGDGYNRTFTEPTSIQGRAYTLTIENDNTTSAVVTVTTAKTSLSTRTPSCVGTIVVGVNRIGTRGGVLYCNS